MKAFSHARAFIKRLFSRDPKKSPALDPKENNPTAEKFAAEVGKPESKVVRIPARKRHSKYRGYCKGAFGSCRMGR